MNTPAFEFLSPTKADHPYSVSEINEGIALILESGNTLVWVEGEISNWRPSSNGHVYFKLKDQASQIPAVLWRSTAAHIQFKPEEGMAVMVIGSLRVYQRGGSYQLDVHRMTPAGKGALYAAFEQLKSKLEKEGLFDQAHKRPVPSSVATLGVITSKRGAAIKDIVKVIHSRSPQTEIVLIDVAVQGEKAPAEIAQAIQDMNEFGKVDLLIIGQGGGSIEDLWAFNDESVARAIYNSKIPVISAVGHEIDFTIADFVADVRAPTPSAAAEMAVADSRERRRYVDLCLERFTGALMRYFGDIRERYDTIVERHSLRRPVRIILESQQRKDELRDEMFRRLKGYLQKQARAVAADASRLNALSPLAVLTRGYSVVQKLDGTAVKSSAQVTAGEEVKIRFCEGSAGAQIKTTV